MVIPRGAQNPNNSWEYIKWTVAPETQKLLAKERLMVNPNPTTKYNSPTIEALVDQAWTEEEKAADIAWETRQLEIMDWLTDDVDWITGEKHDHIRLVCAQ